MGRIRYSSDVGVSVDVAFSYVDNYVFVPDWLFGVSRFEPVGDLDRGLGAIFETSIPLGPWTYNFETEVTEHRKNTVITLTDRNGRLGSHTVRFDPLGCGRSVLTIEIDYGRSWYLLDRFATSFGNTAIRRSEHRLGKGIEQHHGLDLVGRIA